MVYASTRGIWDIRNYVFPVALLVSGVDIGYKSSFIFNSRMASLPSSLKYLMPGISANFLTLMGIFSGNLFSGNLCDFKGRLIYYLAPTCLGIFYGVLWYRETVEDVLVSRRRESEDFIRERQDQVVRMFLDENASDSDVEPDLPSSSAASAGPLIPAHLHEDEVLSKYVCPITGEPIRRPVLDPTNGITIYERSAIMRALRANRISPTTRKPLSSMQLIHLPALERFIASRIEDQSTIAEELQREAEAELERHKKTIQSRLKSNSASSAASAAMVAE